jgi:hypothetical protein
MARQVDYEALVAKLEVTDVYVAIHEDEPVLIAACMDCDSTILRAIGAEVNAAELHLAILEHDCAAPADVVVVNDQNEISELIADAVLIEDAESPTAEPAEISAPTSPSRILSLADRCDRCRAQAFVRIETGSGSVDLCGHDYAAAELTIAAAGYSVIDERGAINSRPSVSASAE